MQIWCYVASILLLSRRVWEYLLYYFEVIALTEENSQLPEFWKLLRINLILFGILRTRKQALRNSCLLLFVNFKPYFFKLLKLILMIYQKVLSQYFFQKIQSVFGFWLEWFMILFIDLKGFYQKFEGLNLALFSSTFSKFLNGYKSHSEIDSNVLIKNMTV